MDTLFGLEVVVDDSLHDRAVAEGMGLEDEARAWRYRHRRAQSSL